MRTPTRRSANSNRRARATLRPPSWGSAERFGRESTALDLLQQRSVISRPNDTTRYGQLAVVVAVASVCALFGTVSFVSVGPVDAFYRFVVVVTVGLLFARARRERWLLPLTVAVIGGASLTLQLISVLALIAAGVLLRVRGRVRRATAAVGGVLGANMVFGSADMVERLTFGAWTAPAPLTKAVFILVSLPALRSGWRRLSRRRRARLRPQIKIVVAAGLAGLAIVTMAGLSAGFPALRAIEAARDAQTALSDEDLPAAIAHLDRSADAWETSHRRLSYPGFGLLRLIPIAGPHLELSESGTAHAAAITSAGIEVAQRYDESPIVDEGSISTDAVERLIPALDSLENTIATAEVDLVASLDDPLLLPVLRQLEAATDELASRGGTVREAVHGLELALTLFGPGQTQDPTDILVLFSTPAEARGLGGFIGSWAHLQGSEGSLELVEQYRSNDLNLALEGTRESDFWDAIDRPEAASRYDQFRLTQHVQDVTMSPDGPTVGALARELFVRATGVDADAVIIVDPYVLDTLISYSGGLELEGLELRAGMTADLLLREQYVLFRDDDARRETVLASLIGQLLETLQDRPPHPVSLVQDLKPHIDAGRLIVWTPGEGSPAEALGLTGAFPSATDVIAVTHQNAGQNKIDGYLERQIELKTALSPDGAVRHELAISLTNSAGDADLPPAVIGSNDQGLPTGTNRALVTIYSPHLASEVLVDGQATAIQTERELGVYAHTLLLDIGPETTAEVALVLAGPAQLGSTTGYELALGHQPMSNPDEWRISIDSASGWRTHLGTPDGTAVDSTRGGEILEWEGVLDTDVFVTFKPLS